jgi:Ca-activated chloride channel family protein
MQFLKPENFFMLWALPLIWILFVISKKIWHSRLRKFATLSVAKSKLIPNYKKSQWFLRSFCLMLSLFFFVMALARPQWGEEKRKIERKGVDLIFMIDTSMSMLAEDVKPNRLKKSKIEIKSFVHSLTGDRIGMVAFAGSGFLQAPLTLDYSAFFLFLDAVDVGYIPDPGSSLTEAIKIGIRSFPEESLKHKAVIIFSDGEDHDTSGLDPVLKAAQEQNVRLYTIGVGTPDGEPIPLKDELGRRTGYKKDRAGQVVVTRLDSTVLERIAKETGGVYFPSTPGEEEVELVLKHLQSLGKRQLKEKMVTEKEDHYQLFLFLGLLFVILEMLVRNGNKIRRAPLQAMVILLLYMFNCGFIQTTRSLNDEAAQLFAEKKYESALKLYREAQTKNPDDPTTLYNLGATLYEMQEYQEARRMLQKATEKVPKEQSELRAKALYNYGNTLYRLGAFEEAIKAYEQSLEANPDDEDAKYNLEFLQKTKDKFEKENQDQQQQNDEKQENDQDQEQDQENQQGQSQQDQKDPQQGDGEQDEQNQQGQGQQDQKDQQGQGQQDQQNQQGGQGEQDQKDQQGQGQQDQQNQQGQGQQDQKDQQGGQGQQDQKDQQGQGQQDQQNQQGGQGEQDQKDQQGQGQQDQQNPQGGQGQQDQKDQQGQGQQDQKDQQGGQGQQDQKDQQGQGQQDQQNPQGGQGQQDQQDQQGQQGQQDQQSQQQQGQEQEEQDGQEGQGGQQQGQTGQGEQQQEGQQGGGGGGRAPLQGQMTKENAERILDALEGGEKELQDLRRPPSNPSSAEVLKDW